MNYKPYTKIGVALPLIQPNSYTDDKLIVSKLSKKYIDFELNVSFEITKGEFLSILGPSGSGKSTILKLIAGLEQPNTGIINMFGRNLSSIDASKRNMGIVFQDYTLFPHLNVFDNIAYGLKVRKEEKITIRNKVYNMLEMLNMKGYEKRTPQTLSGGEQQRVAIARALVINPDLFLLDEPFSSLDTNLRKSIRREIVQIQRKLKITTIFITHNQEEALSISDKILLVKDGKVVQFGKPSELYENPTNDFAAFFLGDANIINNKIIRPEKLTLNNISENQDKEGIKGIVSDIEYFGSYYHIYIKTDNYGILQSKVTKFNNLKYGDEVFISIEK